MSAWLANDVRAPSTCGSNSWREESDVRLVPKLPKPKTKAGRTGMIIGGVVGGLLALDLLALAATAVIAATAGLR
jgi:hypothetical protein